MTMRGPLLTMLAALCLAVPAQAGPLSISTRRQVERLNQKLSGCIVDFTHNHGRDHRCWSDALSAKRDMYVYLPPGYDPAERYPVMIWMHGFIQDEKNFLDVAPVFDEAMADGRLPPM